MPQMPIYLDYAAATPLDPQVLQAMQPYFVEDFYNPSATYLASRKVHQAIDTARANVAHWLGARPSEITFTAGGTEANNMALHGIMRLYPHANMVTSAIEHESVLAPAKHYKTQEAAVGADGRLNVDDVRRKIDDQTVLVSVMYANNEVGTIQPIRELSKMVQKVREERRKSGNQLPLYLHTDACQAANYLDLHVSRLGVDLMTINGGKIYGPKHSGALYVKAGIELQPLVDGGGQEHGMRSGTENVAAIIGMAKALDVAQGMRESEVMRLRQLQQQFVSAVGNSLPKATLNGSAKHRLPNNVHLTFPGIDNERLLIELDVAGVMAAAGSACSASNEESSHVLHALGLSDEVARSSVRFTLGRQTTTEMIKRTAELLAKHAQ